MKIENKIHSKTQAYQDWNDLTAAGAWSKKLLWNKPTLRESIKSMESKFNIDTILSIKNNILMKVIQRKNDIYIYN